MKKWAVMVIGTCLAITTILVGNTSNASAKKHYQTTPVSLRGTWYKYDKEMGGGYTRIKITKYTYSTKWYYTSGITLKTYDDTHAPRLAISKKNKHGYYKLYGVNTDNTSYFKRADHVVKGRKRASIKQFIFTQVATNKFGRVDYWYHYKL